MKINNVVFAKNEVLKMVMTRAWGMYNSSKKYASEIKTFGQALKKCWAIVKAELFASAKTALTKVVSYFDYKNNPSYKGLKTVANSYNTRKKEITVILNSVKRSSVNCICGHPGGCYGDCIVNQ